MKKILILSFCALLVITGALGVAVYMKGIPANLYTYVPLFSPAATTTVSSGLTEESDPHVRFLMEAFDSIQSNFWMKADQYTLPKFFELAVQKVGISVTLSSQDRQGTARLLRDAFAQASTTEAKKVLALQSLMVVLYNLPPVGRNNLLSHTEEVQLRQEVSNVNPNKDLYANIGATAGASTTAVETAYKVKAAELVASSSPEAKKELADAQYAHKVLTSQATKARYDAQKIEPTVFVRQFKSTLYMYVEKIAPTTLQEFAEAIEEASTTKYIDSLVLDFRGNVGGSLDFTQAFMGIFIGQNQYAFDLFHQGVYDAQRTTLGVFPELTRFTDIAILTDNMTQSTAELTTASMKRLHLAHVVGATTRGWGSVENTYPLKNSFEASTTYTLLLVNSLTLRDDNQPVEGNGVIPDILISDSAWKNKLSSVFRSASLIETVRQVASGKPLK